MTEIGEKGINLSGGQKARVSLARAVYKRPDVIIMDDPISALDSHTRKSIFDEVFCGILKGQTRVLATHAIDFVHLADKIVILKEGKIAAQGTFEELKDHPYINQVQEIHNGNRDEIKEANEAQIEDCLPQFVNKASISDQDTEESSENEKSNSFCLSDSEISAKLESFAGLTSQLDEATASVVNKLLVDEKDEALNADRSTYTKLFKLAGGVNVILLLVVAITFFKYFDFYSSTLS